MRFKMKRTIERFKEVESAFNEIKKATRISTTHELINEYLKK